MNITITDGTNAAGDDQGTVTLTEGDLDTAGDGVNIGDTDTSYPAIKSGTFVIAAGEDRLVPDSVKIDPSLQADLITELQNELTSGGQPLTFSVNTNGDLIGELADGTVAVTVALSGAQQGQDINVTVEITQQLPLDHNDTDTAGYVTFDGDDLHINVPVQATDTDDDDLDKPANIEIIISDGADVYFGFDNGVIINESAQNNVITGNIPLNVGSDEIDSIVFHSVQPELEGITSNGLATTYIVQGSIVTVYDITNTPVLTVTVATDGSYEVTVMGPVDQTASTDSINIDLAVTATDKDGDVAQGSMDITIIDGDDAVGGNTNITESMTLTEGDLDVDGTGSSYPVSQSGEFEFIAGVDRLQPNSLQVDPLQVDALISELASELTSAGQALNFSLNADGNIVGRLNGEVALTVELSALQNGQDLTVTVVITQNLPLDHKNSGDIVGYITSDNDQIGIKVPLQATDSDGDFLLTPTDISILINDGANPSFAVDSDDGTLVNESSDSSIAIQGQLNLDIGSDTIKSMLFAETQQSLENLTSNGNDTRYDVDGKTITLFNSDDQPIMVITVETDGKYTVTVSGPIDQQDSLSTDLNLAVTVTDQDDDSASGTMKISITDGINAAGGETANVEITEPLLSPNDYPMSADTNITLSAGSDRLDVDTVGIDLTQKDALIDELKAELTSGGEALIFTLESGALVGKLATGETAVSIIVTSVQDGQNVTSTIKIEQFLPLDHNPSGNSAGFVSENGDSIAINIPLQGKDTDGDSLDNPAVITVTIKDGQVPSFGDDSGISLNEQGDENSILSGSIIVNTGSDAIESILFDAADTQSAFNGVTSNGNPTTVHVDGDQLLLKDSGGNTVLEVNINIDGTYTAKITGELDQSVGNKLNLPINVTVTDDDGDSAKSSINIEVIDGLDATGGQRLDITAIEGDLETVSGGSTYIKTTSGSFEIAAGEDRLDPTTVSLDSTQTSTLIAELESTLTSAGENLQFILSNDGTTLVGTTRVGGDIAVTITLTSMQNGDGIDVNVEFKQHLPLDHNKVTDSFGLVKSNGDDITISLPVQAQDTDGDNLVTSANVDITIQDGDDPAFAVDDVKVITETEGSQTITSEIGLDVGSDVIAKVEFDTVQASLDGLITNGQSTSYKVEGNVITVSIKDGVNDGDPVLTITINKDGTYTVKQDEPLEQDNNAQDEIALSLGVLATDNDDDVSNQGKVLITIKDGLDATGENISANLTVIEGQAVLPDVGVSFPTTGTAEFTVEAVNENLVADTMRVEDSVRDALLIELNNLTSDGEALTFTFSTDTDGMITIVGSTATTPSGSTEILLVTLTPEQKINGHVEVSMSIKQSGALDHNNNSGTYVKLSDDKITVDIPVQMRDSDDDPLIQPVNVKVTISDGANASGNETAKVEITEPGLSPNNYPVSADTDITLSAGADRLLASTVGIDPLQKDALINELKAELTSGGEALIFTLDNGVLVGKLSGGEIAVSIRVTSIQNGQDVTSTIEVEQFLPLDQNTSGNSLGFVSENGDSIAIKVPLQGQDRDGDSLDNPAVVTVTINDGQAPSFGLDSGILLNEESNENDLLSSSIVVNTGSDEVKSITFDAANMQSGFDGITSNGNQTEVYVDGDQLLLKDSNGNTVLEINIDVNGNYTAKITGELDQVVNNELNFPIKVIVTDSDDDSANGIINIKVTDGDDAIGGQNLVMTVVEGDLETSNGGSSYPKNSAASFDIGAGEDRLDPSKVSLDSTQLDALIDELELTLTTAGESLEFIPSLDGKSLVGTTTPGGQVAVTITLSGTQLADGDGIKVNVDFQQSLPLDHNNAFDNSGFVQTVGDDITISVPVQALDTDGDDLVTAAKVDITIKDGDDPVFAIDDIKIITETEGSQTISSDIGLDVGSDAIANIDFNAVQASLVGLTTNGQATSYKVDGNVITVSIKDGVNDGDPVLTITINTDGTYTVKQDEPLEQDNNAQDEIALSLGVLATDNDDDVSNQGQVLITIKDGLDATGEGVTARVRVVEGDIENPSNNRGYPSTGTANFTVEALNDNLVADTTRIQPAVQAALLAELNDLTSNGEDLAFTFSTDINGLITITGSTATIPSTEILQITLTPEQQINGDVKVNMLIEQSGPLDHNNDSGRFVKLNSDKITVRIPVQMSDSDGDALDKPVNVIAVIKDGDDPKFGADSTINLNEGNNGIVSGSGQIDVDTGSDQVVKVYFDETQSSLNNLTSNGQATAFTVSADGKTLLVTLAANTSVEVMKITVDINGNYQVEQTQPIDQVDDPTNDQETIIIDVFADDVDGDSSLPGHINIVVNDGMNAIGGQTGSIIISEGDLTPAGIDGYPVTGTTQISVIAGVDRLDPDTVEIDSDTVNALIIELQNELTAGGVAITFTYSNGILTGVTGNVEVMSIAVTAAQNTTNDKDVEVTLSITQNQPLDHQGGNSDGMVSTDGDQIKITVPVQIKDTDGDKLDSAISVGITINDGDDPLVTAFEPIVVDESALNNEGSNPSSNDEKANGKITVDSGSDEVTDFIIDVATFNQQNTGALLSNGQQITLSYNTSADQYEGKVGNSTIFVVTLSNSGEYEFTLKDNIDHKEGTATDLQQVITLPIQAVDQDGDKSITVNVPITIKDDQPSGTDVTLSTVEGQWTGTADVLADSNVGADGAKVTSVIIDGVERNLIGIEDNTFIVLDDSSPQVELGTLYINANGDVKFQSNPNLPHDIEEITETITVNITDGDGDTDSSIITLKISDQDATLSTSNSSGFEDNSSPSDSIDANYQGIVINMEINAGDIDRGESVDTVTITPVGDMHGDFIFNGAVIIPNVDGSITLGEDAFVVNGNIFTLTGVTFMPDEDFSTINGDLNFDVSAEIINTDGSKHPGMTGSFTIHVDGVADIPTWDDANTTYHYTVTEDTDSVDLNLTAILEDDDGANTSSEDLYYFITIKQGEGTLVGDNLDETAIGSNIYKVPAEDIGSVQVTPAENFSGDIKLDVYAQSEERDNSDTADSVVKEIIINVIPDADQVTIKVKRIESDEDQLIDLKDHIFLTPESDNDDGSEQAFVRIDGLPTDAILLFDGQALVADVDGKYEVSYDDIDKLQLKPIPESNVDFTIKVEGVIKDTATITNPDGTTTTTVVNEYVTAEQTVEVDLTGVADDPNFDFTNTAWTALTDGRTGLETTIDQDNSAVFDFTVMSSEHVLAPTDNSETLSLVISNLPEGVTVFDANGNEQSLVYVGTDANGHPKYEVNLDTINGITITPPLMSTADIDLDVRLVVTENDGDSKSFDGHLVIHVEPMVDATDYSKNSNGNEDNFVNLNWQPELIDSKEVITGLVIKDLPADYELYIGNTLIASGGGEITLTAAQVVQITTDGQSLRVIAPEDSDVDITLKTQVTITEVDVDSTVTDVKNIEGTLNVNINAVVENDGILAMVDNNSDVTNIINSDANGVIDININTTGDQAFTNGLSFIEDDLSSAEVIEKVIITLVDSNGNTITDQNTLDQFLVTGGINDGDGSWTVPQSELDNLQIIATVAQTSPVYVRISAEIRDLGDNNEGDSSSAVIKEVDSVIELDFQGVSGGSELAGNIDIDNDVIIIGSEDKLLDFGDQLNAFISISTDLSEQSNDVFTLVISGSALPSNASITGAEYNYETDEYVLNVDVDSTGAVDFSALGIQLPQDFSGDFELDVKYVNTDNVSGDVQEVFGTIPVKVNPVVDIPSNSQIGESTPEIEINVVKTDGLDSDKQPITDGSADVDYTDVAYEDGVITLDLSVALADNSSTLNQGLETVTSVTLTVDATNGFFVESDGSLVSEITLLEAELNNIQFKPEEDFSGSVSVAVKVDITDTVNFDQIGGSASDSGSYSTNVSFDVVAVNDAVTWTGPDKIIGQEDAGGISLTGVGGSIVDVDDSEQILSIKLTGVPDDFIIEGAANNSNGEWSISVPANATTFNLDNIKVIPPEDFSGEIELNVVVYSKEDSLDEVAENTTPLIIDVQPVADRVDTDIETEVTGTENDIAGIELILNIEAFDDANSYLGSGSNVIEKGPESLQITLNNIPDSSSIILPSGVIGTVTNNGGGSWLVTVESSDLDKLIFHPGDANNVNWDGNIDVDIRAVDNGVVADDSIAIDETIHVEIEADNDAPENVIPTNLIADEDVPLLINSLKVVDVDAEETPDSDITVTLNVGDGTLNVPDSFDWDALGLTVTGESSETLVIMGSLADINALLASGVEYTGDANFNGDDTLTMTTNDQANSGIGPVDGLTDSDSITITVNPVNDAPVNTVPDAVIAEEDGSTVITGMQISDVDFIESGTTGAMSVTLSVANGNLSVDVPVGSSVVVTDQGTDLVVISGSIDEINAVLTNGVTYQGDANFSGADELTMTTHDGGNVGSGSDDTAISKVAVTVTPKVDIPTLSLNNSFIQTSAIRASSNTMIPLLGLIAIATDASEILTIEVRNLGSGQLVDSNGQAVGSDLGGGVWLVLEAELADLHVIGLSEGDVNLEVVAVSEETDGTKAESVPLELNVFVDNLANTNNQIGATASADAANLVIDSSAEATLLGGDGADILIGGTASDILIGGAGDDILWGGDQFGTGDAVKDSFVWQSGDFGVVGSAATDTIMDFEVGVDSIDLTDAFTSFDSMSLSELSNIIKLTGNGVDSTLEIYDDQGGLIQNIVLNGVTESALLGSDPASMSDEDKLGALLNSGQLDVAENFGNKDSDILNADNSGESLYGFDGSDTLMGGTGEDMLFGGEGADILSGGEGNDILAGGNDNDLFTWENNASGIDTITDFKLDEDQLDLSQILSDGDYDKFTLDDLLLHSNSGDLTASYDAEGNVNLTVKTEDQKEQVIVLDNIDASSLGGASSADILNQLFSHDAFKVDPNT
ncbi:DUF5801 repeats-in-toxin domain-containing protein [Psychromonas marina]|uniref:T1SS-143 repeat domain-containing protein n=1 Tax=Psychromonas marina TaxID=88364 RepID=UPI0024E05D6E|nr:hypothetical protein [Psychromonas marina]